MCLVCMEYQKGLLTKEEAIKNLGEMIDSTLEKIVKSQDKGMTNDEFYHLLDLSDELKGKEKNPDVD